MNRFVRLASVALAAGFLASAPSRASAQVIYTPSVSYYAPPASVRYSYYPSSVYVPPTTVYSAPATVYAAPPTVYSSPVTVYSAPTTVYSAPAASFAVPATTVYSAPPAVYYPPTVVNTGVVTTRSYYGLGVFRPFGRTTVSTYTPSVSYYYP